LGKSRWFDHRTLWYNGGMAMDATGVWHPTCNISACQADQADDGLIEATAFVGVCFVTVRIHVCAFHRDAHRMAKQHPVAA
jgi:hypothetical protein